MRFRPDKYAVRHVEAETSANVSQKVIAALEIRAASETAGEKWLIKTQALNANPTLQFRLRSFAQWRSKHRIEVIENRPVRIEKNVHVLVTAPCHFPAHAEILLDEKEIAAESGVSTAPDALRSVVVEIGKRVRRGLACDCAHAKSQIELLSVCSSGTEDNQASGRNQK